MQEKSLLAIRRFPLPILSAFSLIANALVLAMSLETIRPLLCINSEACMLLPPGAAHKSKTTSFSFGFSK